MNAVKNIDDGVHVCIAVLSNVLILHFDGETSSIVLAVRHSARRFGSACYKSRQDTKSTGRGRTRTHPCHTCPTVSQLGGAHELGHDEKNEPIAFLHHQRA